MKKRPHVFLRPARMKRNLSTWKPWTSRRELEESRREEERMREELRQKEQLEWRRQQENQDLQARLERERKKVQQEREERAQSEARVWWEQDALRRAAEARREEVERQARAKRDQQELRQAIELSEARTREEMLQKEALEKERRRKDEELRKEVKKQEERLRRNHQLKLISPDSLYVLRELIRKKYALDVEIWTLRHVRKRDQGEVEDKMGRADAILQEIRGMVGAWQGSEKTWDSSAEWEMAQEVQGRLLSDGKREWMKDPPWKNL